MQWPFGHSFEGGAKAPLIGFVAFCSCADLFQQSFFANSGPQMHAANLFLTCLTSVQRKHFLTVETRPLAVGFVGVWLVFVWFGVCLCSFPHHHFVFPFPSMTTWAPPTWHRTRGKEKLGRTPKRGAVCQQNVCATQFLNWKAHFGDPGIDCIFGAWFFLLFLDSCGLEPDPWFWLAGCFGWCWLCWCFGLVLLVLMSGSSYVPPI